MATLSPALSKDDLVSVARQQLAVSRVKNQSSPRYPHNTVGIGLQAHAFNVKALFGRGGFGHVYRAICNKSCVLPLTASGVATPYA